MEPSARLSQLTDCRTEVGSVSESSCGRMEKRIDESKEAEESNSTLGEETDAVIEGLQKKFGATPEGVLRCSPMGEMRGEKD